MGEGGSKRRQVLSIFLKVEPLGFAHGLDARVRGEKTKEEFDSYLQGCRRWRAWE